MSHPTKNLEMIFKFPDEYDIQIKSLAINEELVLTTERCGYLKMKYNFWMLPDSGIAWRFIPKPGHAPTSSESIEPPPRERGERDGAGSTPHSRIEVE